jgi:hypothetical protein
MPPQGSCGRRRALTLPYPGAQARQGEVVALSREILAAQAALARSASQAEADGAARQLADKHEARDAAIVQLGRLEEVQALALRQPGANERQARPASHEDWRASVVRWPGGGERATALPGFLGCVARIAPVGGGRRRWETQTAPQAS